MSLLLSSILALGLAGQPPPDRDATGDAKKHLAIMKNSMAASEVRGGESGGDLYRLTTEPVLRFTNTVGDSRDGSIFLWLGDADRPEAAVQVFQNARRLAPGMDVALDDRLDRENGEPARLATVARRH